MEIEVNVALVILHLGLVIANLVLLTINASIFNPFHILSFHKFLKASACWTLL